AMCARNGAQTPSAPPDHAPRQKTLGILIRLSWLQSLKSWSLRQTRGGSDFMAGWALAQALHRGINLASKDPLDDVERAAHAMFSFGDTASNDRDHHGEPHYRAVMVRGGYDAGNLGVKEAFEKGAVTNAPLGRFTRITPAS